MTHSLQMSRLPVFVSMWWMSSNPCSLPHTQHVAQPGVSVTSHMLFIFLTTLLLKYLPGEHALLWAILLYFLLCNLCIDGEIEVDQP